MFAYTLRFHITDLGTRESRASTNFFALLCIDHSICCSIIKILGRTWSTSSVLIRTVSVYIANDSVVYVGVCHCNSLCIVLDRDVRSSPIQAIFPTIIRRDNRFDKITAVRYCSLLSTIYGVFPWVHNYPCSTVTIVAFYIIPYYSGRIHTCHVSLDISGITIDFQCGSRKYPG